MQLCNYELKSANKMKENLFKISFVSKHNNSTYLKGYFTSVITRRGKTIAQSGEMHNLNSQDWEDAL